MNTNKPQLTVSEKISLGKKEIARRIRQELKQFAGCKFSVINKDGSINISLMKANFKVIKDFKDIPEQAISQASERQYTSEGIKANQEKKYHQLNQYTLKQDFNELSWCNGVFLTLAGHELFRKITAIADYYNYDNSDISTDYFDTNFYLHLSIGQWDKPFQEEVSQ